MVQNRRFSKPEAMGRVFVSVGKAICIREMYTEEPSYVVLSADLRVLLGSGPTAAAAWIDAARDVERAPDGS
jgi:hypothetical protein